MALYHYTIDRWGTLSPPVVWYMTDPHPPANDLTSSALPSDWRPNARVVVSLTTMPHRVRKLNETLTSLLTQSVKPDIIYVSVPTVNKRLNESYEIPVDLDNIPGVKLIRLEQDFGPVTKLVGGLLQENNPSTIVITVDDDFVYAKDMIRTLAFHSEMEPGIAFGPCGWQPMYLPFSSEVVASVYVPYWMRGDGGRYVEVLQGCCGIAYRRGMFKDLNVLKNPPKGCYTTDDVWIAGVLATSGVRKVLIPERGFDPVEPSWKAVETVNPQKKLSYTNPKEHNLIKCFNYVNKHLGPWWHKEFE